MEVALRYWWVNQNQTYRAEVSGGFLWSPKTNRNGGRNHFYDNMKLVRPGDLVFSFCDTQIKAIGIAAGGAESKDRPEFGSVGEQWTNDGWFVPVAFTELRNLVRPKDFIEELVPHLAERYAPIRPDGGGNQVYLAEISEGFALALIAKIGVEAAAIVGVADVDEDETAADAAQAAIEGRTDIGPTEKQQLVQARRGQGIFRTNVGKNEKSCRITGVSELKLLVASHIKPWAKSSDQERLDGCNGLLLAPHVDALFDKGWISFGDDGSVLVSPTLDRSVLKSWSIDTDANVGSFHAKQCVYLAYHRSERFKA